jgi:hypothetical protein
VRGCSLTKAKMTAKDGQITLTEGKKREVIDLATGKLLQRAE